MILGREQPSPRDAERRAMVIWYDTKRPIRRIEAGKKGQVQYPETRRPYKMCDGSRQSVNIREGLGCSSLGTRKHDRTLPGAVGYGEGRGEVARE
jgi:hypothetical protein